MRVLIVGAGPVGQVYGFHLQQGGAQVGFFVKEVYRSAAEQGYVLHPLNGQQPSESFSGFGVCSTLDDVRSQSWDQLWITVAADALAAGDWVAPLIRAAGDPLVVLLTPTLRASEALGGAVPPERLVTGLIALVGYQAPLPGEDRPPGVAYWLPPRSQSLFQGPAAPQVVAQLRAGGLPAGVSTQLYASLPAALFHPYLVGLAHCDWQFTPFVDSPWFALAGQGANQALAIMAKHHGVRVPWRLRLLKPPLIKLVVVRLVPRFVPFPFEAFIAVHFAKVQGQTHALMRTCIELGRAQGQPVHALQALLAG